MKQHSFLLAGLIAAASALTAIAPASAASLITNGSFENYNAAQIGGAGYASSNTTIDNWTGFASDSFIRIGINGDGSAGNANSQVFANNGVLPDGAGSHVAFLQAPNPGPAYTSLSQSISGLVNGTSYELTFYTNARDQFNAGTTQVGVALGTQTLLAATSDLPVQAGGNFTLPYHFITVDFTYDVTWGSTLTFLSTFTSSPTATEGSIVLDDVSLVAVPEPSTVALGAIGLAGFAWRLRRRKA